ncbi:uncharacterized protein SPPG_03180 [Spizellomyces punctatus DAOM BR117]|uniref:Protein MAK16 n=1 Tax=Spizellomyces punctatus (strain DAOM BR117) TaxID=645134 RepID=A0A0L0HJR5_SPIPD|nr:uncharacterized protein SPPG_03180 [Spizellomyces punctatus DAOM BR117]KND01367.1 hypothetical protein SPPG_03180 [Spizellomyces punctatus DAOM BR117]|eukprot:XP_016609406.1 hypothetical protein SPPG_03180 [Spizellomyces punctatus DAOM BR117]
MQCDELIWKTIAFEFCSFKVKTPTQNFCRNENNVTGLCNRQSCPLANSRYATIREHNGILYLYIKTIERAHTPAKQWEKIRLSKSYTEALAQIDKELVHWPSFTIHKCKQRLTKITQYLIRMRKLVLKPRAKLIGINKKIERRETRKEAKAEAAARLETAIEKELLERLRKGVYGDIVNERQTAFVGALDRLAEEGEVEVDEEEEQIDEELEEEEEEEELDREFVSDVSDDEWDLEDGVEGAGYESDDGSESSSSSSTTREEAGSRGKKRKASSTRPDRKRPHMEIEYETEPPAQQTVSW